MTIPEIQQTKERFVLQVKPLEAKDLGYKILTSLQSNNVQQSNPEAYEALLNEAISLLTYSMHKFSDEEFENFIRLYVTYALRNQGKDPDVEVNFIERFETRYMLYPNEYEIVYKTDMAKLLHTSTALIGTEPINISMDKPSEAPTVANWLAYYEKKHGDNYTDSFKRSQFLAGDEHVQRLDTVARQDIQNLLTFMDYLNEFPALINSLEEDGPASIESLSPPQPARETMSREILETPVEEQGPPQRVPGSNFTASGQPPLMNESASDVMSQPPVEQPRISQDPPKFLGQQPPRPSGTVDLSKVKLPDTKSKQTIDLKKLS
jgi:hypothetical protein